MVKRERKVNLIKALKKENAFLKRQQLIKPVIVYNTNLQRLRLSYLISNRVKNEMGEKLAIEFAKHRMISQFQQYLEECELHSYMSEDDTTMYIFDFFKE